MVDRLIRWLARMLFPLEPLNDGGDPLSMENVEALSRRRGDA